MSCSMFNCSYFTYHALGLKIDRAAPLPLRVRAPSAHHPRTPPPPIPRARAPAAAAAAAAPANKHHHLIESGLKKKVGWVLNLGIDKNRIGIKPLYEPQPFEPAIHFFSPTGQRSPTLARGLF